MNLIRLSGSMKNFILRFINLVIGLMLFALGIILTIKANLGYAPWDVFHEGLANTIGFSFGVSTILVGVILGIIVVLAGEKIGIGTILNMVLIGVFLDIILYIDIIPTPKTIVFSIIMLISGLFIISIGSYFYIKSALGAGPRDCLMVVLTKKTKIPVGICRSLIELLVTVIGWLLGGKVGIGTIISVIGIGFCIQITFKIFKFKIALIKHESILDTINTLIIRHTK